jgi:subfamily B ATP-binding cassette protein MsbA
MGIYRRLLGYVVPFRGRLIVACLCMFGYTLAHSLVSVTVFIVLNGMQNQHEVVIGGMPKIAWLQKLNFPSHLSIPTVQFPTSYVPLIVITVFLIRGFFDYVSSYQMASVGLRAIRKVRDDLYEHLVKLSMDFYAKKRIGELMSRTMNDVVVIQGGITDVIVDLVKQPFVIIFNIGMLIFWGGPFALIALVVFPIGVLPIILLGRKLKKTQRQIQEKNADLNSAMQETFSGINVVKAFNMEPYETHKFMALNKRGFESVKRSVRINSIQKPLVEVLGACGIAFAIIYGIKILSIDRFAAFLTTLFLLYEPLKKLSKVHMTIQQSVAAGVRIFELLDEKPSIASPVNGLELTREIGSIRFKDVSLAYVPEKMVLKNINLSVRGGQVIAIVGSSGSGKTSLVNLLLRFYDPVQGVVEINGSDIRQIDLTSLREKIGIVTQETFLFNTTVFENIAYGRLNATLEEVKRASEAAYADEFIPTLPQGYGTIVGDRGVKLSGGQRQRLAIARAILRNPPILILDEATSQLDTESEREVQAAIERLMAGRTVFVIAHRLSTVQNADRIVVLDEGRLVQEGTNGSLLKEGGVYKRLYDLQFNI